MITFQNVYKTYGQHHVLKNINLKLPRTGLVAIQGSSGCGKTTLLNTLSGLLDFEGDIEVDGHHINLMNEKELDEFRLKNYGFIFQDFKLFENETVINNVMFPLEVISGANQETRMRKCQSLVSMVGLKGSIRQKVSKLSGGEKQRVAIARALANSPKIILADEPTGALDSKTGHEIMKILQGVSSKSLVLMVSHDEELAQEYADEIIKMQDGQILSTVFQNKVKKDKYLPIAKMFHTEKKPSISSSFLFNHTVSSIKNKKWRTSVCNMVTSLGLIGVGLAASLSSAISSNIKKSYSQIIDDSKITLTLKNKEKGLYGIYAASFYEASELAFNNQQYIYDIGCTYYNEYESFFPHSNCLVMADTFSHQSIEGISARHINEFRWLDIEHPNNIYPNDIDYLRNDQVVLSLTIDMVYDICFQLRIERTVTSLSRYLQTKPIRMYFDFRNDNWQYSDQQIVEVVGFTLENSAGIYHNNHMWNEYMFEERMRFPIGDRISGNYTIPWVLKKIYYFYCYDNVSEFLKYARHNKDFNPYILEIANETYYPWSLADIPTKEAQKVLIFANTSQSIPLSNYKLMKETVKAIDNPVFGSSAGYSIYPSSMMYGFSRYMYFSGSEESLTETIDINTSLTIDNNQNVKLPNDVISGHFSQTLNDGMNFKICDEILIKGHVANSLDEIVISKGVNDKLFQGDGLGKTLYVAYLFSQTRNSDGEYIKHFKTVDLKVVGIKDDSKNLIYHDDDWTIGFFQTMLGVSAFDLGANAILLDVTNQKEIDSICQKIERAFPEFVAYEPMSEINKSVNQVCFYLEIALMCFSIIAVVISVLLLSICNYLYILENKKDIGLVRCIGVNKKEARKLVITHSVIMCFISFVLSSIELVITSLIISKEISSQMGTPFEFSFNPLALIYMFSLAFSISIISSLLISRRINKLNPIAALK